MENQQETTESNETQLSTEKDPFESLNDKHKKAVELKLDFFKHKYIAGELKVEEQTVRAWFMQGGLLREAYEYKRDMRDKEYAEMITTARKELRDLIPEAVIVIRDALVRRNKDGVEAAFKVLGIEGISVVNKVEVDEGNKKQVESYANLIDSISENVKRLPDQGNKGTD